MTQGFRAASQLRLLGVVSLRRWTQGGDCGSGGLSGSMDEVVDCGEEGSGPAEGIHARIEA